MKRRIFFPESEINIMMREQRAARKIRIVFAYGAKRCVQRARREYRTI